jgi:hypothetical protein
MVIISDELKEEFTKLLDEQEERHRQDIEDIREQHREAFEELRNEVEASKDDVEAFGFSRSIDGDENEPGQKCKEKSQRAAPEEDSVQGIEIPLLPHDTFSYLAFVKICSKAMLMTMIVILVQMTSIVVLLVDKLSHGSEENWIDVPSGGM